MTLLTVSRSPSLTLKLLCPSHAALFPVMNVRVCACVCVLVCGVCKPVRVSSKDYLPGTAVKVSDTI